MRPKPNPCPSCGAEAILHTAEMEPFNQWWLIDHAKTCPNYVASLQRGLGSTLGKEIARELGFTSEDAPVMELKEAKVTTDFMPLKLVDKAHLSSVAMRMLQRADRKEGDGWLAPWQRMGIVDSTNIAIQTDIPLAAYVGKNWFQILFDSKTHEVSMARTAAPEDWMEEVPGL